MRLDLRWAMLALLFPIAAAQASTATDYAYAFALDTPSPAEAYRVVLAPEIYAAANPTADLRDLVVVNALGQPVPFGPMPSVPPKRTRFEQATRLIPVPTSAAAHDGVRVERSTSGSIVISQPAPGNAPERTQQWLLDAGRDVTLDRIELQAASLQQDFQLHLAVDASNDLREWRSLADDVSVIRVHSGNDNVEQLSMDLSSTEPARYYRLRLVDGEVDWSTDHVPTVALVGAYSDAAAEHGSQLQWLPVTASASAGSNFDYTLPAALPVEALTVRLPANNAAARVQLLLPQGQGTSSWAQVATLDLVRTAGNVGDATARFDPRPIQHVRLHSETPLAQAPTVSAAWVPPQYVFMAEGSGPYRLLVGSYAARRGDYPVNEAVERMRANHGEDWLPPMAALDQRVDAAGPAALVAPKVPYDWTRPLLWAVLIAGALLVAGMALSLLRNSGRNGNPS